MYTYGCYFINNDFHLIGICFSKLVLRNFDDFKKDFKEGRIRVQGEMFEALLEQKVRSKVLDKRAQYEVNIVFKNNENTPNPLSDTLEASNSLLFDNPSLSATAATMHTRICNIHKSGLYSLPPLSDELKLLSLQCLPQEEVEFLYSLLLNVKGISHAKMTYHLEALIPKVSYSRPLITATQSKSCANCQRYLGLRVSSCFHCQKRFCDKCQLENCTFSRLGQTKKESFCSNCTSILSNLDAEDWMHVSLEHIKQGTIGSTKTGLGCLSMALACSTDKIKPIFDVAQAFLSNNLPELAMILIATIFNESMSEKMLLDVHILTASALNAMAAEQDMEWESRLELLQAATEVCQKHVNTAMQAPALIAVSNKTSKAYVSLIQEDPLYNDIFERLNNLWATRNIQKLLEFVKSMIFSNEKEVRSKMAQVVVALVNIYDKQINMMPKDDQAVILLLQGLVKLEKNNLEALADIEKSIWIGDQQLEEPVVDIYINLLTKFPLFSTKAFYDLCLSKESLLNMSSNLTVNDRCLKLIFPNVDELNLPFEIQWPNLGVVGLEVKGHVKFEKAVGCQVKDGNWDEWEAAIAYLDYIAACDHPAQYTLCFLYSSLWLYKYIKANPSLSNSQKYALTKAIAICSQEANGVASLKLSPVMKLYVARMSLGILLHTLNITKLVANDEVIDQVASLINVVIYNSRFCPLWDMPFVPISEAVLLSIKANRFHSKFLICLQDLAKDQIPLKEHELHYKLYENDLSHVHPLQDPATAKSRAMQELLIEKGWVWNDVRNLLTSQLSPRDSNGWLKRSATLGKRMEFAEIKGFRFNSNENNSSVELIVIPAAKGSNGLFSLDDVYTVLEMGEFEPALFSLDPPNVMEQHYHPFQQFLYEPKHLQNTDFLHTMFETDYLMKSFTIGTEISAKPPFLQRPCKDGLLKGLPEKLCKALKPINERPGSHGNKVHRFWIQADKLEYCNETNGDIETFRVNNIEMVIRSHPLFPGQDGKLEDTEFSDDPESPEAQFAADMTAAYNEISKYFPMFARLRELAKLQFIVHFLNAEIKNLKQQTLKQNFLIPEDAVSKAQKEIKSEKVKDILKNLDEQIGVWPGAEDQATVSMHVDKLLAQIDQQVSRSEVESLLKPKLVEADNKVIPSLVDTLLPLCDDKVVKSTLETLVREWLMERNTLRHTLLLNEKAKLELSAFLNVHLQESDSDGIRKILQGQLNEMILENVRKYQNFCAHVKSLKPNPYKFEPKACSWVPAAMYKEESQSYYSLCYGGVFLYSGIKKGYVPPLPGNAQVVKIKPCDRWGFSKKRHAHTSAYRHHDSDFAVKSSHSSQSKGSGKSESSNKGKSQSGGTNGTRSDGGTESNSSAHPGAAAGGKGGDGGDGNDDDDDFDDDFDDEGPTLLDEEDDDYKGEGYKRIARSIQKSGIRGVHTYMTNVKSESINPQNISRQEKQSFILLAYTEVLNLLNNLGSALTGKLLQLQRLKFDDYIDRKSRTITGVNGKTYDIPEHTCEVTGETQYVIYCIMDITSQKKYIGKTKQPIETRIGQHLYNIRYNRGNSLVTKHFRSQGGLLKNFKVIVLEVLPEGMSEEEKKEKLPKAESGWMEKLGTRDREKGGLNKIRAMREYKPEELTINFC